MEKVKLRGGEYNNLTLQGDISGSRLYVDGWLYIWNKTIDQGNYRIFEWNEVRAL